jgi:hypothetical protein
MPTIQLEKYLEEGSAEFQECLEACVECLVACEMCANACLDEKNVAALVTCIRLDRDCAESCATAIRSMSRGGPLAQEICRMCADACDRCAEECERHAQMHEHCRLCAAACRRCADECRRMAGDSAHAAA